MSNSGIVPIAPVWAWEKDLPPAPGVQINQTIYLSGQLALDRDGNLVGPGDLIAQTRQCFSNIRDILARAGAGMNNVVKMTTYFTTKLSLEHAQDYWKVRQEFFGLHRPASTGVQVQSLLYPECLLEIEVIAVTPGGTQ